MQCTKISSEIEFGGHRPWDVGVGYDVGKISAGCLVSPFNLQVCSTELNQNWPHARKCDLKMHVHNLGYPSPTNRGPKTP